MPERRGFEVLGSCKGRESTPLLALAGVACERSTWQTCSSQSEVGDVECTHFIVCNRQSVTEVQTICTGSEASPPRACTTDTDCAARGEICAPGEPELPAVCIASECETDDDCPSAGDRRTQCLVARNGACSYKQCSFACPSTPCSEGKMCALDGTCDVPLCPSGHVCPPTYDCMLGGPKASEFGCVHRVCAIDADCNAPQACRSGKCEDGGGVCFSPG